MEALGGNYIQLIAAIENGDDFEKIIEDVVEFHNGIIKILDDLEIINEDVKKLVADLKKLISDFMIALVRSFENLEQLQAFLADINTLIEGYNYIANRYICYEKEMTIQPETTDNFGNRLIHKNTYIPAVLSITDNDSVEENKQFSNALSDFQQTANFTYQATNTNYFINYKN